jgi:hypothetical protein
LALPLLSRLYTPSDFALHALFIQLLGLATVVVSWRYEYLIALPSNEQAAAALQRIVIGRFFRMRSIV